MMTTDGPNASRPESFEDALAQLQKIVDRLERGEFSLEESVSAFERGMELLRFCGEALAAAEKRVRTLIENESGELVEGLLDDEDGE